MTKPITKITPAHVGPLEPFRSGPFEPSSWHLEQQIARAMRACDAGVEQARMARMAREAREDARIARQWEAEAKARRYARIQHPER